jgi:glucose/arabinose dehydrogenase
MSRIAHLLLFILLLPIALAEVAQQPGPTLECQWTDAPPRIDGNGDEPCWRNATIISNFRQPWLPGAPAVREGTKARLLWDREWIYFLAEMEDTAVSRVEREHDGPVWEDDAFELFFRPSKDHAGYFEFEVSPLGATVDAFFRTTESWRNPAELRRDPFHMEAKATIHESAGDGRPSGWTAEGRIPWSDFNVAGGRPAPSEIWSLNLARVNGPAPNSELSTRAPLQQPSFHRTDEFVPLRFIGPAIAKPAGWKNECLLGSPNGPAKYQPERVWPQFKTDSVVTIELSPDKQWMWFVSQTPYREGATRLGRFRADGEGREIDEFFASDEVIYSIAFHPRFAENGFVFLGANGPLSKKPRSSQVIRYTARDGRPDPASRTVILEWPSDGHNGAALAFANDGILFVSSGDGTGDSDVDHAGQNTRTLCAKILRIDVDHPDPGRRYAIPTDNPFVKDAAFAPETWAYGLRNPWRMSFDRVTGQLWEGENGQDQWEFARLVQRGANYGWSRNEGGHVFRANEPLGPQPITPPTIEHPHSEFRSLTGGFVYHGKALPELEGAYVYGDWGTGRLWAAKHDGTGLEWQRELCDTPFAISQLTPDANGEILLVDYGTGQGGAIYRLAAASPPVSIAASTFPRKLSETGLFTDTRSLTPAAGVLAYDVSLPGWHDGAVSLRHIALPDGGGLEARAAKSWQAPDETVLAQTLVLNGHRVETRMLVKLQNDWAGYSYVWDEAQTDATLAEKEGVDLELRNSQPWRVPSRAECMMCHSRQANFALTLHDAQLNVGDQLIRWERMGMLTAVEPAFTRERQQAQKIKRVAGPEPQQRNASTSALLPSNPEHLAKFVPANDEGAPLEARARSYLGANCAHCHTMYGGGNSAMDFDWFFATKDIEAIDRLPQHGTFDLPDARVIAPGAPGRSVVIPRVARRGAGQMPPVGTRIADPDGVRVLAEWITSLPADKREGNR